MNNLKSFLFLSMMCVYAAAGQAQDRVVNFRYLHNFASDVYLLKASSNVGFIIGQGNPASFILEEVSPGHYLIKYKDWLDYKYLYANARRNMGFEFTHDGFDETNGYFDGDVKNAGKLLTVNAVRQGNVLRVGDKQIDLEQTNNFVFSFPEYVVFDGKTTHIITSDIGATASYDEHSLAIIMQGKTVASSRVSFFIEDDENSWSARSGLAQIYRTRNPGEFLSDEAGFLNLVNIYQYPNADLTFYLDSTGIQDCFLLARNAEKMGDCIKGRYLFVSSKTSQTVNAPCLELINAIHKDDVLYVLGNEIVSDFSTLDDLASAGKISKVNLKEDNDFCFYFKQLERNSSDCLILKDVTPDYFSYIRFFNNQAVLFTTSYEGISDPETFDLKYLPDTLKNRNIVVQPTSISWSRGSFHISLAVPASGSFTATFNVVLPPKFTLDASATKLVASLESAYGLKITPVNDSVWSFGITPKATRSNSLTDSFREVANIAYTVDKSLANGDYKLKIKALNLKLADGTEIREDEIVIPVTFNSATGNAVAATGETAVWSYDGNLHVSTPATVKLSVYTLTGALQKQQTLAAGETVIALPAGIYIVKIGDAVQKIVVQ